MRTVVFSCVLGVVLVMPASVLRAQQSNTPTVPTITLHARGTHTVAGPLFSHSFNECDGRGNVFFDLAGSTVFAGNILRISEDGQYTRPIPLPAGLGKNGEWHFSVDPDGGLYAIFSEVENHVLIHLSSSGEEVSRTTLQLPRYFHVHSFAVLSDGRSMFFGYVPTSETSAETTDIPFSIWLDSNGRLVRKTQPGKEFSSSLNRPDGLIAAGRPGTFIEAINSEIRVFGAGSDLLQTFPIVKPTKDSFSTSLQFVDGYIAIAFQYPANTGSTEGESANKSEGPPAPYFGPLEQIWLLANPASGEVEAFYKMSKDFTGSALCYLGHREFLYLTVKDGHDTLVEASE
jgi:hypothetical protein